MQVQLSVNGRALLTTIQVHGEPPVDLLLGTDLQAAQRFILIHTGEETTKGHSYVPVPGQTHQHSTAWAIRAVQRMIDMCILALRHPGVVFLHTQEIAATIGQSRTSPSKRPPTWMLDYATHLSHLSCMIQPFSILNCCSHSCGSLNTSQFQWEEGWTGRVDGIRRTWYFQQVRNIWRKPASSKVSLWWKMVYFITLSNIRYQELCPNIGAQEGNCLRKSMLVPSEDTCGRQRSTVCWEDTTGSWSCM